MSITLYHCTKSRSMRTLWALEELGVEHELVTLPFPPRVLQKDYLAVNALGTVPCLVDGDTVLTESAATCQYLAERHGPTPLAVQPDEADWGAWLNWLHRSDATLTFPQTLVLRYTRLEPEERRNPQVATDYRKWFLGRWRSVEAALEGREWLVAGRFTMADIAVGYALVLAETLGIEEAFTPNVQAWYERFSAREAFQRALR